MTGCVDLIIVQDLIRRTFPVIDEELCTYITGVLEDGTGHFASSDEVYDAIGDYLHAVAGEDEDHLIEQLCQQLLKILKSETDDIGLGQNGEIRKLAAPVHLREVAAEQELKRNVENEIVTIAGVRKDCSAQVDYKKLEKADARSKVKQGKRSKEVDNKPKQCLEDNGATVSQTTSRRETRLDAKGTVYTKDVRIELFDIAFGDRLLFKDASLLLISGRRYGLVGRNGLGKTTLLRMISSNQLKIPSNISMLHVEQEVVGDDTLAIQSVLECDELRESLLKEEAEITKKINSGDESGLQTRLNEVYTKLQEIEADKAPARASVILSGLGFDTKGQQQATKLFSGGWRMRLALARALFSKPDLLLLDEPTNMLDMKAILWLESYLQSWSTTLLFVSHDRQFLDVVPTDILHLHSKHLDSYRGAYSNFIKTMTEKLKNQQREYEAQQQHKAHVQEFIDKFRYNAKRASLVQSKIKMLEKLPELQKIEKIGGVVLNFPPTEPLAPPIIQLDDVAFHYVPDKIIFGDISVSANMESRICIVGENGTGKSTLLKIIMGELSPVRGIRHVHRNLRIGYFSQHHIDQLDMTISSVEFIASKLPGKPVEEYRRQLGSFGVSGDLALQQINTLSGGQKSRVAFAAMCMNRPNFLILDEPTNHLDVETIEALAKAINKFTGGVILVAHDERLIRSVCKELWVCQDKSVKALEGGFDEYRAIVQAELELPTK
uniref:ABC transporter domain-containing protein n=1 Tax=Strigamia maritima TaxID=126957 RepID=T1JK48_STRMM